MLHASSVSIFARSVLGDRRISTETNAQGDSGLADTGTHWHKAYDAMFLDANSEL